MGASEEEENVPGEGGAFPVTLLVLWPRRHRAFRLFPKDLPQAPASDRYSHFSLGFRFYLDLQWLLDPRLQPRRCPNPRPHQKVPKTRPHHNNQCPSLPLRPLRSFHHSTVSCLACSFRRHSPTNPGELPVMPMELQEHRAMRSHNKLPPASLEVETTILELHSLQQIFLSIILRPREL